MVVIINLHIWDCFGVWVCSETLATKGSWFCCSYHLQRSCTFTFLFLLFVSVSFIVWLQKIFSTWVSQSGWNTSF